MPDSSKISFQGTPAPWWPGVLLAAVAWALYSLAAATDRRTANTFTLVAVALPIGTGPPTGPAGEPLLLKLVGPVAWLLLPTSLGTVNRLRAACLDAAQARAEHTERTREEEARRRVAEERRQPVAAGGGYGLIGMRERARSAGGRVRTGHRPDGGFEVVTELPLDDGTTNESHPA